MIFMAKPRHLVGWRVIVLPEPGNFTADYSPVSNIAMQKSILLLSFLFAQILLIAQPKIQLVDFSTGFNRPLAIENCGDSRLFIVEQAGKIWIVDSLGVRLPEPFLDIDARVYSLGNEQGLLGLAFHPNYAQNGYFYVNYIKNDQNTRVARFSRDSIDPNKADPNSEFVLFDQAQPYSNHNGGCVKFSPVDGYLYLGLGDGGSANDPQKNGQKKNTFLAKILRLDVDSPTLPYGIPADNPFVDSTDYKPEIWALGLRNPWRFSFDRLTGDLWIGDVGQNAREEVDFEPAGSGGHNYGWKCFEGTYQNPSNAAGCLDASHYTPPVYEYANPSVGCSMTGGYIYRGTQYSDLYGVYLNTDYCSGRWWATKQQNGTFSTAQIADLSNNDYSSLGEDNKGELYVAALAAGKVQKIKELCSPFQISGTTYSPVCNNSFSGEIDLSVTGATGNTTYIWSSGQTDQDIVYLNPGTYTVVATDGNGCVRRDTFTIESSSPAPPTITNVSGDTTVCAGVTLVLQASTAPDSLGYQWYSGGQPIPGATGQQLQAIGSGPFSVVYSDAGCYSVQSPSVAILYSQLLPLVVIGSQNIICPGDTAVLLASGAPVGYTIKWYSDGQLIPGANAQTLSVTEAGNYAFEISGVCGTFLSNSFLIDQEFVIFPEIAQAGDTLVIGGSVWESYQWYLNGVLIPGATTEVYIASESGLYTCNVVSEAGCTYQAVAQIEIINTTLPASVTKFSLSPNPTQGLMEFRLELQKSEHIQLSLLDVAERQIFMQTHQSQSVTKTLDLHNLPAGTYFLHVQLESGRFVRKVVKQ